MEGVMYTDLVGKDEINLPYVGKAVRASCRSKNTFWVAKGGRDNEERYGVFMIDNGRAPRLLEKFSEEDGDCYTVLRNIYNGGRR